MPKFQFHNGSIKSYGKTQSPPSDALDRFQFHNGSIKSLTGEGIAQPESRA